MRHVGLEQWVDFVLGIVEPRKRKVLQNHLDTGCKSCAGLINTWQRVHRIAQREAAFEPPDRTVRLAKRILALRRPPKRRSRTAVHATLLFDSFVQPQTAGVRSSESAGRQLLFGVAEFHVDLRIEPQEDPRKVTVVGQVLNLNEPAEGLAQTPVALFRRAKLCAETLTNRFGEFRLDCLLETGLYLRVSVPEGPELRIPVLEPKLPEEVYEPTDSAQVKSLLPGRKKSTRKKD